MIHDVEQGRKQSAEEVGLQIPGLGAGAARHLGKETGQREILVTLPLKGEELKEGGNVPFKLLVRLVGVSVNRNGISNGQRIKSRTDTDSLS